MFRNKLNYYHGTTLHTWHKIKAEGILKPDERKPIYDYWLTKGVYFVVENPFIALWYSWVKTFKEYQGAGDKEIPNHIQPIVLNLELELDNDKQINLLCCDGHNSLHDAHETLKRMSPSQKHNLPLKANFDSYALQLLLKTSRAEHVIAAFQEGNSFQFLVHNWTPKNTYNNDFSGVRYGYHIEICFGDNLEINLESLKTLNHSDIVVKKYQNYWKNLCKALTEPLPEKKSRKLKKFMKANFY